MIHCPAALTIGTGAWGGGGGSTLSLPSPFAPHDAEGREERSRERARLCPGLREGEMELFERGSPGLEPVAWRLPAPPTFDITARPAYAYRHTPAGWAHLPLHLATPPWALR